MKCKHENSTIIVKQILYSEIHVAHLEVYDGDPEEISCSVECPDCGLNTVYHVSQLPKWIKNIIQQIGLKSNYGI